MSFLIFPNLVVSVVGFAYPAYCSSKALHEKDLTEATATQWLAYWMIYTAFIMLEGLLFGLLSLFPFYASSRSKEPPWQRSAGRVCSLLGLTPWASGRAPLSGGALSEPLCSSARDTAPLRSLPRDSESPPSDD